MTRERKVALPFVLEKLDDPDTETRGWATHVLCELPYLETIAPLLLRLRDMDLSTRVSAAHALAAVGAPLPGGGAQRACSSLAHSADPIDRAAAMRVMGELREPSLVPDLVRALADGDEAVVAAAHAALVLVTRQDFGLDARPWLRWWELNASRRAHRVAHRRADPRGVGDPPRRGRGAARCEQGVLRLRERSPATRPRARAAALPGLVAHRGTRALPAEDQR